MTSSAPFGLAVAPVELIAPDAAVSLWWCSLVATGAQLTTLERWLSEPERKRMQRFGTDELRTRYAIGRGTLRWLLGRTLQMDPAAVRIVRGTRGRPRVDGPADFDFNVSHTGNRALIGIARGLRIGVDVERRDRAINSPGIARKFMSERERAALANRSEDAVRQRILRLWTCKEAMAKATGDALSAPFSRLDVEVEPVLRLTAGPAPYVAQHWSLHAAAGAPDHIATVALWREPAALRGGSP